MERRRALSDDSTSECFWPVQNGAMALSIMFARLVCDDISSEKPLDRPCPYAREQKQHPVPGQLVGRVRDNPQVGDDVADVGRLVELASPEELEPDAPLDHLRLERHGGIGGTEEHGYLPHRDTLGL